MVFECDANGTFLWIYKIQREPIGQMLIKYLTKINIWYERGVGLGTNFKDKLQSIMDKLCSSTKIVATRWAT